MNWIPQHRIVYIGEIKVVILTNFQNVNEAIAIGIFPSGFANDITDTKSAVGPK
jgi:hypothetical protein